MEQADEVRERIGLAILTIEDALLTKETSDQYQVESSSPASSGKDDHLVRLHASSTDSDGHSVTTISAPFSLI